MSDPVERRVLEGLTAPIEADIRLRDPTATIEWFIDEGLWWYRLHDALCSFEAPGSVTEPPSEKDRQKAILRIAENIADNLWPDEWIDPWPLCPGHRDHPLQPRMSAGRASWVCRRDPSIAVEIGTLRHVRPV